MEEDFEPVPGMTEETSYPNRFVSKAGLMKRAELSTPSQSIRSDSKCYSPTVRIEGDISNIQVGH